MTSLGSCLAAEEALFKDAVARGMTAETQARPSIYIQIYLASAFSVHGHWLHRYTGYAVYTGHTGHDIHNISLSADKTWHVFRCIVASRFQPLEYIHDT